MDHRLRAVFVDRLPIAAVLSLILGILGLVDGFLRPSSDITLLHRDWAFNPAHHFGGRCRGQLHIWPLCQTPSQGAVDNGAACAILSDFCTPSKG